MNATHASGHLARFIRLLHTPVHLPGWGQRRQPHRAAAAAATTLAPLEPQPRAEVPVVRQSMTTAAMRAAAAPAAVGRAQAAVARPAADPAAPSRMTRSLAEVRADLARMREQTRVRAEQSQAHAQALAELRDADRARRDIGFAPTDFMDFHSPAAAKPAAPQELLDRDALARSFASTDFQDFDFSPPKVAAKTAAKARDSAFEPTAFQAPGAR